MTLLHPLPGREDHLWFGGFPIQAQSRSNGYQFCFASYRISGSIMVISLAFRRFSSRAVWLSASVLAILLFYAATAASADWREELGVFRIALISGEDEAGSRAALEPFRLAVQEKLGLPAELRTDRQLGRLIINQSDRPAEYVVLPASAYAAIWLRCECIEPLVIARTADGEEAVRSVLIVRRGSAIKTLAQLGGKTAFGLSEHSLVGFEIPRRRAARAAAGINWQFSATAEETLHRFAAGEGDVLAGWAPAGQDADVATRGTLARLKKLASDGQPYLILWQSDPIPNRVHAVRKNLDGEAKRLLRELLTGLNENDPITYDQLEPDYSGGFFPARQGQFSYLIEFLDEQEKNSVPREPDAEDDGLAGENRTGRQNSATVTEDANES